MTQVIGTAGWSIPASDAPDFPNTGSALERYAACFGGVEINSSFHRPHRRSTWERWAASVPAGFRFSVKMPKTITHQRQLIDCEPELSAHIEAVGGLGPKLAIHLVQLPPSLAFDAGAADQFFAILQALTGPARIACEPRHASWFSPEAEALLVARRVARVAADPAPVAGAAVPGAWRGLAYFRLHGSPVIYRSSYDDARLEEYRWSIAQAPAADVWCIFDNTASSVAVRNALKLSAMLSTDR